MPRQVLGFRSKLSGGPQLLEALQAQREALTKVCYRYADEQTLMRGGPLEVGLERWLDLAYDAGLLGAPPPLTLATAPCPLAPASSPWHHLTL